MALPIQKGSSAGVDCREGAPSTGILSRVRALAWLAGLLALHALVARDAPVQGLGGNVAFIRDAPLFAVPSPDAPVLVMLKEGEILPAMRRRVVTPTGIPGKSNRWVAIVAPSRAKVWVSLGCVDIRTGEARGNPCDLRAGPGNQYEIVGKLPKGTVIDLSGRVGRWVRVDAPLASVVGFADATAVIPAQPGRSNALGWAASDVPLPNIEVLDSLIPSVPNVSLEPIRSLRATRVTSIAAPAPTPRRRAEAEVAADDSAEARTSGEAGLSTGSGAVRLDSSTPEAQQAAVGASRRASARGLPVPPPETGVSRETRRAVASGDAEPPPTRRAGKQGKATRLVIREGIVSRTRGLFSAGGYVLSSPWDGEGPLATLTTSRQGVVLREWRGKKVRIEGEESFSGRDGKKAVLRILRIEEIP